MVRKGLRPDQMVVQGLGSERRGVLLYPDGDMLNMVSASPR